MADLYTSFAELSANERYGEDFAIELSDRGSAFLIIAPHGGWIEPGTTEVAKAIAGADLSYYSFSGLKPDRPHGHLHVTSERFDEPQALELIAKATYVVAIHGMKDKPEGDDVWIGGRGTALKRAAFDTLTGLGFSARIRRPGETLAGLTAENICNKGSSKGGLQLEISRSLRDRLRAEPPLLTGFSESLRRAL